jgi:tetratricopeptide (TPR) repeat protein
MGSYQLAVDVDSTLARAWARLAWAAAYTPKYADLQREATRRALELRDRLSTRDRSLLEANDDFANGRFDEAEQLLRGLVASHPTDGIAWFALGDVLLAGAAMRARSFDEVIDAMERAVALGASEESTLINKYWAFAAGGKPDRALECLERYLEFHPKGDNTAWFRAILAFQKGSADDREVAIEQLRQADPGFTMLVVQNLVWFENLDGAARAARIFTDASNQPEFRARGYIELAQIDLARGKWRAAQANLDAAGLLDPSDALEYRALLSAAPFLETRSDELRTLHETLERWDPKGPPAGTLTNPWITPHEGVHPHLRLYLMGLLSARLGDQEKSAQYADELASLGGNKEAVAVAEHLAWCVRAHIDVAAENQEGALEKLELGRLRGASWEKSGSSAFYSQVYERYTRAEVLRAAGQNPEALRWYETASKHSSFDVVYLAPSYLRRAEIYEQLGEKKRAIDHYRRFLELWQECDPELRPTLEKAQISLARLEG